MIDTTLHFFWNGSYGSIYPTLSNLEKKGFVEKEESSEGRGKITYTITDAGKDNLREWLKEPVVKDELRYETLLKLFLESAIGTESVIKHIDNFEKKITEELAIPKMMVEQLEGIQDNEDHRNYLLTARFGVETYQGYLR